jgi:hypothetical protein
MSDITIRKTTGCSDDNTLQSTSFSEHGFTWSQTYLFRSCDTLTITNFDTLDFALRTPVGGFPIPELRDTCNILVKSEGNELTISLSFTMKEEGTSIFTPGGSHAAQSIKTVQEQLDFWLNTFQPNSIEDGYVITVDGITRLGVVRNIQISKQAGGPTLYNVKLDFIAGNVVAGE